MKKTKKKESNRLTEIAVGTVRFGSFLGTNYIKANINNCPDTVGYFEFYNGPENDVFEKVKNAKNLRDLVKFVDNEYGLDNFEIRYKNLLVVGADDLRDVERESKIFEEILYFKIIESLNKSLLNNL